VFIYSRISCCFYAFRWSLTPSSGRLSPTTISSHTVIIFTLNCNKLITQKLCLQFSNSVWSTRNHDDGQALSKSRSEKDLIYLLSTHECAFRVFHFEQFPKVKVVFRQTYEMLLSQKIRIYSCRYFAAFFSAQPSSRRSHTTFVCLQFRYHITLP
jgi:hypothetical protein